MGSGLRLLAFVAVFAIAAIASPDEAPPVLQPHALELLPITQLERKELSRDNADLATRIHHLRTRLQKLQGHLAGREDPNDSGSRQLRKQIRQTEADMAPYMARVIEVCREHDLTDALIETMNDAPHGPHRVARHAQGLVLFVLADDAPQRVMFERIVPAAEGAILTLEAQKGTLRKTLAQAAVSERDIAVAIDGIDRRIRAIEKRFWRLVDYVVPQAERTALHRALPTAYKQHEDAFAHIYAVPGLTASQATRLSGMLTEFEAESAPDTALTKRLQQQLRSKDINGAERARIHREMQAAQNRVTALHRAAVDRAKAIYTTAQWTMLEAIPPRVSLGDRKQTSPQVLAGLRNYDHQKLAAMRAELEGVRRAYREKRREAAALGKDYGPDSPQMASMQMAMANVEAEANVLQREFNGRLFTELLSLDQVVLWVINPQ